MAGDGFWPSKDATEDEIIQMLMEDAEIQCPNKFAWWFFDYSFGFCFEGCRYSREYLTFLVQNYFDKFEDTCNTKNCDWCDKK